MSTPLDPSRAQTVLDAEVTNIVRKVASGKTLSSSERKLLERARAAQPALGTAKNRKAAAAKLGITVTTLRSACDSGCPGFNANGTVDCDAVRQWLEANTAAATDAEVPDYQTEKARKTFVERQIREIELDVLLKTRRPIDELAKALYELGEEIKASLQFELVEQLPILDAGLDASAIRKNHEDSFHRILARWRDFASKWEN